MFASISACPQPLVVPAREGQHHQVRGDLLRFALTAEDTAGALTVGFAELQPGSGPPPHLHLHEDEVIIVLEGRIAFLADGEWIEGGPGTVAFLPRAVPHAYRNVGEGISRQCVIVTPGGFERFYADWAAALESGSDFGALQRTAAAHGIELIR
jgi:quercetin dioxygenase-like cupin family protein